MKLKSLENSLPKNSEWVATPEERETQKTIETSLEEIDYSQLQSVFDSRLKKYGVTEKRQLLPKDRFKSDLPPEGKNIALYSSKTQTTHISPHWARERFGSVDMKLAAGMILCHEQTHHMSHRSCIVAETATHQVKITKNGFDETFTFIPKEGAFDTQPTTNRQFTFLNEGLTEMFSREVYAEYLNTDKRYAPKEAVDDFFQKLPNLELAYNKIVPVVTEIIASIALHTGIDKVTVKEAFYRAMIRGESITDSELVKSFNELYGERFLPELATQPIRGETDGLTQYLAQQ